MSRTITVHLSVPDEHYTECLRVLDTLEYIVNQHKDPNIMFVGVPSIPGLSMHSVADSTRSLISAETLGSVSKRFNANIVMLKPVNV